MSRDTLSREKKELQGQGDEWAERVKAKQRRLRTMCAAGEF